MTAASPGSGPAARCRRSFAARCDPGILCSQPHVSVQLVVYKKVKPLQLSLPSLADECPEWEWYEES